jgi:hypothetical protein
MKKRGRDLRAEIKRRVSGGGGTSSVMKNVTGRNRSRLTEKIQRNRLIINGNPLCANCISTLLFSCLCKSAVSTAEVIHTVMFSVLR